MERKARTLHNPDNIDQDCDGIANLIGGETEAKKKIGLTPYPELCRPCRAGICPITSSDKRAPLTPGSRGTPYLWHRASHCDHGWRPWGTSALVR